MGPSVQSLGPGIAPPGGEAHGGLKAGSFQGPAPQCSHPPESPLPLDWGCCVTSRLQLVS